MYWFAWQLCILPDLQLPYTLCTLSAIITYISTVHYFTIQDRIRLIFEARAMENLLLSGLYEEYEVSKMDPDNYTFNSCCRDDNWRLSETGRE